jgi:hypothetical protein
LDSLHNLKPIGLIDAGWRLRYAIDIVAMNYTTVLNWPSEVLRRAFQRPL